MGVELDLSVADECIESPFLHRAFLEEIVWASYINLEEILTKGECDVFSPNGCGEVTIKVKKKHNLLDRAKSYYLLYKAAKGTLSLEEANRFRNRFVEISEAVEDRERNPVLLKQVLMKVEQFLKNNVAQLPLVHQIYTEIADEPIDYIDVDGIWCRVEGDLWHEDNSIENRNKIRIKSYGEDYGKIDLLLPIAPKMKIGGTSYQVKSLSKAAQFEKDFSKCYTFLDEAIEKNKKILWEIV